MPGLADIIPLDDGVKVEAIDLLVLDKDKLIFRVSDGIKYSSIVFDESTKSHIGRIALGETYSFKSLVKKGETLEYKKTSVFVKAETRIETDSMTAMTSNDLINKPKKLFIRRELIVKVLKVHEVQETSVRRAKYRRIMIADEVL